VLSIREACRGGSEAFKKSSMFSMRGIGREQKALEFPVQRRKSAKHQKGKSEENHYS